MTRFVYSLLSNNFVLAKIFTRVGLTQIILQIIQLLSGLLVVNSLTSQDYAYYTLAGGVLGFLSIIADSGMSTGAYAISGRIWKNKTELGDLVATVTSLRRQFTLVALIIALPVLAILLYKNGANTLLILGLCGVCGLQFWTALPALGYGLAPALHQKVQDTQRINIIQATFRLLFMAVTFCVIKNSITAFLVTIPAQIWSNLKLKKLSLSLTEPGVARASYKKELFKFVAKIFPGSLYYAISGQITIFLISIYGASKALAEVGALGRLGQIMTVLSAVSSIILIPRFARMNAPRKRILHVYILMLGVFVVGCLGMCFIVWLFPLETLWLLGARYSSLKSELLLQFISASISLICGVAYQLGAVRGIIYNPLLAIPSAIVYQILSIFVFDFSSVRDVLLFSIGLFVLQAIQTIGFFVGSLILEKNDPMMAA